MSSASSAGGAALVDTQDFSWAVWLSDVHSQLATSKPVGALPETCAIQLADLRLLAENVEAKRPAIERALADASVLINEQRTAGDDDDEVRVALRERFAPMEKQWSQVRERLSAREQQLRAAESDAVDMAAKMAAMAEWIDKAEKTLVALPAISRVPPTLRQQIDEHAAFVETTQAQVATMTELSNRGLRGETIDHR